MEKLVAQNPVGFVRLTNISIQRFPNLSFVAIVPSQTCAFILSLLYVRQGGSNDNR